MSPGIELHLPVRPSPGFMASTTSDTRSWSASDTDPPKVSCRLRPPFPPW
jgi:hypothetical protein